MRLNTELIAAVSAGALSNSAMNSTYRMPKLLIVPAMMAFQSTVPAGERHV